MTTEPTPAQTGAPTPQAELPPITLPPPSGSRRDALPSPARRGGTPSALLLAVAGLVAIGGLAFAAGRITAPAAAATLDGRGAFGANGLRNGALASEAPGLRGAFGNVDLRGTVTAVNGDTLTVDLANGRTIEVKTDSATTYHQQTTGSSGDVTNGSSVIIQLQPGQNALGVRPGQSGQPGGSLTAQDITVGDR